MVKLAKMTAARTVAMALEANGVTWQWVVSRIR